MPTGYTARLKEMNYNVRRWLKESAVRAIGVTISLRDDGDLSEKEIEKRLKSQYSDEPYHSKKLKEATAKLRDARTWDENDWQTRFEDELSTAQCECTREAAVRKLRSTESKLKFYQESALTQLGINQDLIKDINQSTERVSQLTNLNSVYLTALTQIAHSDEWEDCTRECIRTAEEALAEAATTRQAYVPGDPATDDCRCPQPFLEHQDGCRLKAKSFAPTAQGTRDTHLKRKSKCRDCEIHSDCCGQLCPRHEEELSSNASD